MSYLVKNIRFNSGKQYESELPVEYDYECMAQVFFRSELFSRQDVDFEFEKLDIVHDLVTKYTADSQDYQLDISDNTYPVTHTQIVMPLHASCCVVSFSDQDLKDCDDDIQQCIYEQLSYYLPVNFYYKKK